MHLPGIHYSTLCFVMIKGLFHKFVIIEESYEEKAFRSTVFMTSQETVLINFLLSVGTLLHTINWGLCTTPSPYLPRQPRTPWPLNGNSPRPNLTTPSPSRCLRKTAITWNILGPSWREFVCLRPAAASRTASLPSRGQSTPSSTC